jgi:flagellar basal body P-ring formation protein FlgA
MIILLLAACLPLQGSSDRITARDLSAVEPALAQLPSDTALGYAPAPGAQRVFGAAEMERLATRHGVRLQSAREICVEWPLVPLLAERLLEVLRAALQLPEARIELVEHSRYPVPAGEIEFPRAGLSNPPPLQPHAAVPWKGYVRYAGNRRFAIWARVRISERLPMVVAAQPLPAGREIEAGALRVEMYEGFPAREPPAASIEVIAGRQPRRSIPAGAPVYLSLLENPREVSRGETVKVEAESGGAHLELEARAEANGRRGETIPLRNLASGKRFTARVESPGKVVVIGK